MIWKGNNLTTIGDILRVMSDIFNRRDEAERDKFMRQYRFANSQADANIGYLTGYCENREQMAEFFRVKHPVFDKASKETGE